MENNPVIFLVISFCTISGPFTAFSLGGLGAWILPFSQSPVKVLRSVTGVMSITANFLLYLYSEFDLWCFVLVIVKNVWQCFHLSILFLFLFKKALTLLTYQFLISLFGFGSDKFPIIICNFYLQTFCTCSMENTAVSF